MNRKNDAGNCDRGLIKSAANQGVRAKLGPGLAKRIGDRNNWAIGGMAREPCHHYYKNEEDQCKHG